MLCIDSRGSDTKQHRASGMWNNVVDPGGLQDIRTLQHKHIYMYKIICKYVYACIYVYMCICLDMLHMYILLVTGIWHLRALFFACTPPVLNGHNRVAHHIHGQDRL